MIFSKKDFWASITTGFLTGFIAWRIAEFLGYSEIFGVRICWLMGAVPLAWIVGINFSYFLGRFAGFFNQFGRFVAVGFTNASVDFGVLYLLIWVFGQTGGIYYVVFKSISFIAANIHSYFWNKHWVFDARRQSGGRAQIAKFAAVTVSAAIINVVTAAFVVNLVTPPFAILPAAWAGVGAAMGSAAALVFSFVGFRAAVFKR